MEKKNERNQHDLTTRYGFRMQSRWWSITVLWTCYGTVNSPPRINHLVGKQKIAPGIVISTKPTNESFPVFASSTGWVLIFFVFFCVFAVPKSKIFTCGFEKCSKSHRGSLFGEWRLIFGGEFTVVLHEGVTKLKSCKKHAHLKLKPLRSSQFSFVSVIRERSSPATFLKSLQTSHFSIFAWLYSGSASFHLRFFKRVTGAPPFLFREISCVQLLSTFPAHLPTILRTIHDSRHARWSVDRFHQRPHQVSSVRVTPGKFLEKTLPKLQWTRP